VRVRIRYTAVLSKVSNNGYSISLTLVGHFLRVYTVPYNTSYLGLNWQLPTETCLTTWPSFPWLPSPPHSSTHARLPLLFQRKDLFLARSQWSVAKLHVLPSRCQSISLRSARFENTTDFHETVYGKKKVQLCRWAGVEFMEGVQRCIFALCTALQYMEVSGQLRAPAAICR